MPSDNSAGPGARRESSTDLVAELRTRKDEQVLAAQRQQRTRKRRTVTGVVVGTVLLGVLGVAGKLGWDRYRVQTAMDAAQVHVRTGTAEELELAAAALDTSLAVAPQDADSLLWMVHVRAQQAIIHGRPEALQAALQELPSAESDKLEAVLARGIAAALAGDLTTVASALEQVDSGSDRPSVARARAWLHGTVALGHAFDRDRLRPAIAELATVGEQAVWAPAHRRLAALLLRAGDLDGSFAALEQARLQSPASLGVSADEALINAIFARHTGGVREVVDRLLEQDALTARDRSRVHLARALVAMRKERGDQVAADLDAAWKHAPAWDLDTRALVIESAMVGGDVERGQRWLDEIDPTEATQATQAIHRAWVSLVRGKLAESLKACAKLDQTQPRVAYIQALALVEQGRFAEATPWLDRAEAVYGPRLELRVARARVQAHTGDAQAAVKALATIVNGHHTARALTALGEAQLLVAGEEGSTKDAEKSLRAALDAERRPAEAAFLLGTVLQAKALKQPKRVAEAISLLRKATELDGATLRYRVGLGEFLAGYSDLADAARVLRTAAEDDLAPSSTLLAMASVAIDRALLRHASADAKEIGAWLDAAAARGGAPVAAAVAVQRARLLLVRGNEQDLSAAATSLAALVTANPKNAEARALYGDTLRRRKDYIGARTTLRAGMGLTSDLDDAHLFMVRAAVERSDGSDRLAASLASKGWLKAAKTDMAANERFALARQTVVFWEAVDNRAAQRSVSKVVVRKIPWRADAWAFRALTQLADDKAEEGCANASKALKMDPKLAEAHSARAECLISKRRYGPARTELDKAIKFSLTDAQKRRYRRRSRVLG